MMANQNIPHNIETICNHLLNIVNTVLLFLLVRFFLFFSLFCTTFIDFSIFLSVRLLFGFILSFRRFETKTKFLILKSGFLNFTEKAAAIIRNYVQNPISKRLEMKKNMNFAAIFIKRGTVYHLLNQKSKQSKWK